MLKVLQDLVDKLCPSELQKTPIYKSSYIGLLYLQKIETGIKSDFLFKII
jgi:hypothetical protein